MHNDGSESSSISFLAFVRKVALEKAIELTTLQAHEIWHALRRIENNESLEGGPVAVVQMAMDFHAIPVTWKVIADKALVYEHLTGTRQR